MFHVIFFLRPGSAMAYGMARQFNSIQTARLDSRQSGVGKKIGRVAIGGKGKEVKEVSLFFFVFCSSVQVFKCSTGVQPGCVQPRG